MNTLKMKVLLILSDRYLHRSISRAVFIWVATCIVGCLVLYALEFLVFPPVESIILSLIFSSPALVIAIPFLYHLSSFPTILSRMVSATGIILLTSGGIIGLVAMFFELRYFEVAEALLPFIPSALVCFSLIARKQIISPISY
jgi:hypothetical protein